MRSLIPGIILIMLSWLPSSASKPVRVACIGNSITYGYLLDDPATQSYPSRLQELLGENYEVGNFGRSGATLLRRGHRPYLDQPEFRQAMEFRGDIAIIHLGVNDTDPRDWPEYGDQFERDYMTLIDSLREANPKVRVIIANLTPLGAQHYRFRSGTRQWRDEAREAIVRVAELTGAELIDFDTPLRHRQDLMPDGIHPDAEGAALLARTAYQGITGDYGGLSMPAIYQSGMVMQRDRYLPIRGTANAGSRIRLSIAGRDYSTITDNNGRWQITIPPLNVGKPYEMTVSDGSTTLRFDDILAGEVWIASGQSNMEFPLHDAIGSESLIAKSGDPQLRFFDMKAIARTNDVEWPDSVVAAMDRLEHFLPSRWEAVAPGNAGSLSAVAYIFAKSLRDSLQIPVGVISNAVGGSTCESWIHVTTLEHGMPEILINWRTNDYVMPWAQGRAIKNVGSDHPRSRHPYQPGYLFAAGIEPLGHYPVAGVLWYQGESNAHNTYLHESLFPMLAESWRGYFNNPGLPLVYAQLSSIDRPSWPTFRDSQRRLQSRIPHSYMAVTSDLGDSLDVHPRHKQPVGERLARQALHNVYGFENLESSGPEPIEAIRNGNTLTVRFSHADMLKSSDGKPIRTFEVAEIDGDYHPATATIINNNELRVCNMDIKNPRFVRYGWQPFTRANLVNGDNLPASTFKMEALDATTEIEDGLECGVSGAFAARIGSDLILAGGCNFPVDPMGPASQKKFYRGIYAADTANTLQWRRIGTLPEGTAYGCGVATPKGMVLIGGTPEGKATDKVTLLTISNDATETTMLPSLPVTLDNFAAAAIGDKIYAAGGNADGTPSKSLYMLDFENLDKGWTKLRDMPGNPRVQPVMASATSADGEECLYLWGGFAGRHNGHEPTLELNGLRYSPSKNKWTAIEGPTDRDNEPVSVGGGTACTLSDGRIAVAGGVNKDIFLEALRNQAPDYLQHPAEWYRFNPNVFIYDPDTESWSIEETTAEAARAGASIVAGQDCDLYLLGGEIKPRIRTAETLYINEIRRH